MLTRFRGNRQLSLAVGRWGFVGVLMAVVVLTTVVVAAVRATATKPEPWPPFTMVYRDTDVTQSGERYAQTFRIDYTDSRHYTIELLSHSTVPEAVGWTHVRDGDVTRTVDPRLGTVSESTKAEEGLVPDYWLRPASQPWFAFRPGAVTVTAGPGLARSSISWTLQDGRRSTETLTYRTSDGLPTLYTEILDAKEIRRIEVLELTVR